MFRFSRFSFVTLFIFFTLGALSAAAANNIHGTVSDPSGASLSQAKVELLAGGHILATSATDAKGQFHLAAKTASNQSLRVTAAGFRAEVKTLSGAALSGESPVDFKLTIAAITDQVTVVASGMPTLLSQTGASVTVLDRQNLAGTQLAEERLRSVAGLQSNQVGQTGGTTHFFIRGGKADANKVLIDGVPVNDIGGMAEFANIGSAAIGQVEVLRGPNSVLYGADAMAGVISISTPRGETALPVLNYSAGGGNFGSYYQEGLFSGKVHQFDYFTDYARFDTHNSLPGNAAHMGTLVGNFGYELTPDSSLRATIHHDQDAVGLPNAIQLYGVPSDARLKNENSYFGVTWQGKVAPKWNNLVRYGGVRLRSDYTDFAPVGEVQYRDSSEWWLAYPDLCTPSAAMPSCVAYNTIGAPVTITGANGYTVSGQAYYKGIYWYTYPEHDPTSTDKDLIYAQSDYQLLPSLRALFAFNYENERGYSYYASDNIKRHNYDYTVELQGNLLHRIFYTLGGGVEKNGLFGLELTPRASIAWQATDTTKLRASFGKGIKEPAVFDQLDSLYNLLETSSVCGDSYSDSCAYLIPQFHITPIGPQRSRSYDGGVDQLLFSGRIKASLTLFHNAFSNGIEYVPGAGLLAMGIPSQVATAAENAYGGAMVNSLDFRALGSEAEIEAQLWRGWFARGGYTYTDAVVQRSFTSDAVGPSYNSNFPTVAIGAYSPLKGARPFRVAPHTGYFQAGYRNGKLYAALSATMVSKRDDSTFLVDSNGGTSMLLPNRNLDAAYQKFDLASSYQLCRNASVEGGFQNLFSQHYSEAFGYPALPFNFRLGMKFAFGGESWARK